MVTPIHTWLSADATGARITQARPSKRLSASLFIAQTRPAKCKAVDLDRPGGCDASAGVRDPIAAIHGRAEGPRAPAMGKRLRPNQEHQGSCIGAGAAISNPG